MPEPRTLTHPLSGLSDELFGNAYLLPVAERLCSDEDGWTATTLATALGIQGSNKLRPAVQRLQKAGLVKAGPKTLEGIFVEIVNDRHPFWAFVKSLKSGNS
jgi:hypothetical protein